MENNTFNFSTSGIGSLSQENSALSSQKSNYIFEKGIVEDIKTISDINEDLLASKAIHFDKFQTWATHNYGENSKTKTVTRRKYDRIMTVLTGEEAPSSDNAKFRFWVKAKGFKLGHSKWKNSILDANHVLYVPTKVQTSHCTRKEYKQVAIVDDFFDIIYSMHVDADCRGGKHAGQKRTYRAIAETYAFLPREAVTRFLMSCTDCQKRMYVSMDADGKLVNSSGVASPETKPQQKSMFGSKHEETVPYFNLPFGSQHINFNIPITTTYLNEMKRWKKNTEASPSQFDCSGSDKSSSTLSTHSIAKLTAEEDVPCIISYSDDKELRNSSQDVDGKSLKGSISTIMSTTKRPATDYSADQVKSVVKKQKILEASTADKDDNPGERMHIDTYHYPINPHSNLQRTYHGHPSGSTMLDGLLYVQRNMPVTPMPNSPIGTQVPESNGISVKDEPTDLSINSCKNATSLHTDQDSHHYGELSLASKSYSTLMPHTAMSYFQQSKTLSIQQMITGYRESAAFLYRSAEELERLLLPHS